ncbi:MAG: hypothetical protein ACRD1K_11405 [Acidimicrobiales bacterium]
MKVVVVASLAVVGQVAVGDQPDTLSLTNDGSTLVVALRDSPARWT